VPKNLKTSQSGAVIDTMLDKYYQLQKSASVGLHQHIKIRQNRKLNVKLCTVMHWIDWASAVKHKVLNQQQSRKHFVPQ